MDSDQAMLLHSAATAIDYIARAHRETAAAALGDLGLSEPAASLLWLLADLAPCTMSAAAERLSCDRSNITLLATQLEQRGLAERTPDPADARRKNLHLTAPGQAAAGRLRDAVSTASPLRNLEADERAELARLLKRCLSQPTSD